MTYRLSEISDVFNTHITNLAAMGITDTDELFRPRVEGGSTAPPRSRKKT